MELNHLVSKKKDIPPGASGRASLEKVSTYQVDGKKFIVTPVFQKDGCESFGSLLIQEYNFSLFTVSRYPSQV